MKWASHNVGASKPEDYGGYYAWGETEEKEEYSWETYQYYQDDEVFHIGDNICGTKYDVAHVKWGDAWRMPSLEEITELNNECSWRWTSSNGVNGFIVTGPNGNNIFLPTAGYYSRKDFYNGEIEGWYWAGELYISEEDVDKYNFISCSFGFNSGQHVYTGRSSRCLGYPIRPVSTN